MAGRFTNHRVAAPELVPTLEDSGVSWTVFPESGPEEPAPAPAPPPPSGTAAHGNSGAVFTPPPSSNPLLSDKLLDAKVRLHRRLI
ncbi:MAG: hypothetical protein JWN71_2537 [Xanthobacteraceae bacterium]|nr:hypothetical protein [Xanthobacteraceae bacterium]